MIKIIENDNIKDIQIKDSLQRRLYNLNQSSCIDLHQSIDPKVKRSKINRKIMINWDKELIKQTSNSQSNAISRQSPLDAYTVDKSGKKTFNTLNIQKDVPYLKNVIKNHKIANIIKKFTKIIMRNSVYRKPVIYEPFSVCQNYSQHQIQGFTLPHFIFYPFIVLSSIFTLLFCFIFTLKLIFPSLVLSEPIHQIQINGVIWILVQILINFIKITNVDGQKIKKIKQIGYSYLKKYFWIDFICLIVLLIQLSISNEFVAYFGVVFLVKIPDCIDKIHKFESRVINTFYKQQYWELLKIVFTNFLFAHIIAFFLIIMTDLNSQQNWMTIKQIDESPWYQKYAWSYYWATNIMLTVGFGDISAVNYKEAICLIFIETISCMILAYNINCVGNLICTLRQRSIDKHKSLKVVRELTKKNQIIGDLEYKLTNYVEESYKTQIKQDFQKQIDLMNKFPQNLKQQYLMEINSKVFWNLPFFKNLTNRTVLNLAKKIQTFVAHPGQILSETNYSVYILKQGKIGSFPNFPNSKKQQNNISIDQIAVQQLQMPKIFSLQFISSHAIKNYQIKSIGYSIIHQMSLYNLKQLLKEKTVDFQYFCMIKDKEKNIIDEFEVIQCKFCQKGNRHSKFRCPRLHYIPLNHSVICKYLHSQKVSHSQRTVYRRKKKYMNSFVVFRLQKLQNTDFNDHTPSFRNNYNQECLDTNLSLKITDQILDKHSYFSIQNYRSDFSRSKTLLKAAQIMKKDMENILYREDKVNFWEIQSDIAKDYVYYFREFNPRRMINKTLKKTKPIKVKKSATAISTSKY